MRKVDEASHNITLLRDSSALLWEASELAMADRSNIRAKLATKITTLRNNLSRDLKSNVNHILRTALPEAHATTVSLETLLTALKA